MSAPDVHPAPPDGLRLLPPARTRSQPAAGPAHGPACARRAQSESALCHPPPPPSPPAAEHAAPDPPPTPPSPVPTEIIAPELTQEEIVLDIQRSGIRVRDFAYESPLPLDQCPPELFDPILAWHVYESVLENTNPARNPLNARHLRRLLDLGWVSEHADGHRWLQQDREALESFDRRPRHPWKALGLTQPKKDDLREVATSRFQWVNADQLVPQFVPRGLARPPTASLRGRSAPSSRYQKRPAVASAVAAESETEDDPEVSPRLKKRRMSVGPASPSPPAPSPPAHVPLTLVNGKPPQQFPAGRPSDSPPRRPPAAPPKQGTLSRSLQRHLSMSSIASPCSPDLSRSDSRTTLTQGTHRD